jgi:hypothetical protein
MKRFLGAALAFIFSIDAVASEPRPGTAPAPATTPALTATFRSPIDIDLSWKNGSPAASGHLVEYTSDLSEEFVILAIAPIGVATFHHHNLAPQTKFFYRLRPYLGESSPVVSITTGTAIERSDPAKIEDYEPVIEAADASDASLKKSLRDPATIAQAAPADLTATLHPPLDVALKWQDRANDEEGYLLEAAGPGETDFHVIAFLPPNTIGFRIPELPPRTDCRFRVRAFFYGPASSVVEKITGEEPAARH